MGYHYRVLWSMSAQRGNTRGGDLYPNVKDSVNFHPHLHGLITKGGFGENGIFHPLPWIDTEKMAILFRDKVFAMLIQEGKISQDLASRISTWPHSGFNIHNEVEIDSGDEKGKETLAQYIIKAPVSQKKMTYDKENQKVIYKSKQGKVIYEPLDWIAAINSFGSLLAFSDYFPLSCYSSSLLNYSPFHLLLNSL